MRTKLRSKVTLLFMTLGLVLATPAVALADITLDTSATLATDANLPTSVDVGENSFTINVWRAAGNVGASKTGEFSIVKEYNMAANGTITPDSTKVEAFDWSDLSCGGSNPPVGCSSTNPATINAKLIVAAGAEGKSGQLQISQIAAASTTSGIVTDPSPASGYVQVAGGKAAGSVSINNIPNDAVFGGSFTPTFTKAGDGTPSTTSNTPSVCSVSNAGVVDYVGAGTCKLQASVTEGTNHLAATGAEQSFTIEKATPTIDWSDPADITYGTALSGTQLNATVKGVDGNSLAGNLVYTPAAGTVLSAAASPHTLSVEFTPSPSNSTNYNSATKTVSLVVNKATPVITWDSPQNIDYGTALSATQLNAQANVPGSFQYSPAAGTKLAAGTHTLTANFTPTDTGNYNNAQKTVQITVAPYNLKGFYQPVDMNDTVNTVKNGSTVPAKFELFQSISGTELTSTSAVTSVLARPMNCGELNGEPEDPIETVTTGGTSLRYDTTGGQFIYNWQTPKGATQVGKCYSLTMTAADNSTITAYFKLK